jgi:VWFA-related protein
LLVASLVVVFSISLWAVHPLPQAPAPQQAAQAPVATFRAGVELVEVDVLVTDKNGLAIRDLKRDEIQVLEDDVPQSVSTFELIDIPWNPGEPYSARQAAPDVRSNDSAFNGRLYIIVLDDLHISHERSILARALARGFVERSVGRDDLASIQVTSGRQDRVQDLTNNRVALFNAIDRITGRRVQTPTIARLGDSQIGEVVNPNRDIEANLRTMQARVSLTSLTRLAKYAGTIRGRRKAMIVIGEGTDYNINDAFTGSRELRDGMQALLDTANRSNVSIYTVDPRGLTQAGDQAVDLIGVESRDLVLWSQQGYEGLLNDLRVSQEGLRQLSDGTDAFSVTNENDFRTAFDRVRRDNSTYYVVGYAPSNQRREGKYRSISVRVTRPGAVVRARKGYTEPRGATTASAEPKASPAGEALSPAIFDALSSPLPVSGLVISASAAPFRGPGQDASVAFIVQIDGQALEFVPEGDRHKGKVEFAIVAVDNTGETRGGQWTTVDMPLKPGTHAGVKRTGVVLQQRLALPPGIYQVRIAVRDTISGRLGSFRYDLEVPDYTAIPFGISGVLLSARTAGEFPTPRVDEQLKGLLTNTPITTRRFTNTDELELLAEVYDNQGAKPHKVDIVTTLVDDTGHVLLRDEIEHDSAELKGERGGYGYTAKLPLDALTPGAYVIRIEARSRLQGQEPEMREIPFTVVKGTK